MEFGIPVASAFFQYALLFVYCVQTTFKLGLSYLPLAKAGLAALQAWSSQLPPSVVNPHFQGILPALDDYLKTRGAEGILHTLQHHYRE